MAQTARARRRRGLQRHELLWLLYGGTAVVAAALLARTESLPPFPALLSLCALSALSIHFNADADDGGRIAVSAHIVVAAAAIVAFRSSSPLLGPLLVGMASAFWRVPRTRHEWLSIPGNFGAAGLATLAGAWIVSLFALGEAPSALVLAAVVLPASLADAFANAVLVSCYVTLRESVAFFSATRTVLYSEAASAGGGYLPFLFGAFVGELSLRFGIVVFAFAAVAFVMVQAVFAGIRKLIESERETCDGLIAAVERKDPYTAGHSKRVVRYARYMGERLGFKGRDLARLEKQALMHDVGKLAVPNHILRKPGKLEPDEREQMFRHEPAGQAILGHIPLLKLSADIAAGRGHKDGLDGAVRAAHVVHAADAFDAMTSTRAYRRAKPQADALVEMQRCAGDQFHGGCVTALTQALTERGEVYGKGGIEEDETVYDTPPPEGELGHTLEGQAKAEGFTVEELPEIETMREPVSRTTIIVIALAVIATAAGIASAATNLTPAISLAALVAMGELVTLKPVRGVERPLSLVVILCALRALTLPVAAAATAAGIVTAAIFHRKPISRIAGAAAMFGAFAALDGRVNVLITLVATTVAGLAVQQLAERKNHDRLADLALVACAPLAALATAGTPHHAGLGLGALPILVVPLALLTHGLDRTRLARENLFAWIQAASLAPEHALLASEGRAARLASYALGIARKTGLDEEMQDQLAAAAFMEHVGECCLDDPSVIGRAHRADEIVEESAAILKSTKAFSAAGQVLYAMLREPAVAGNDPVEKAGQILRVAIAFEDATNGDVAPERLPKLFALLRHNQAHALDTDLCDVLQQFVAPGSVRSTWQPVATHAVLSCGHIVAVEPFAIPTDPAHCPHDGAQQVQELAVNSARSPRELIERAEDASALLRELFERAPKVNKAALALAAYDTGSASHSDIAGWMHEAGATATQTADVLTDAGTTSWDTYRAITATFDREELERCNYTMREVLSPQ
jgi:HD-GYP domain-containing protein (c-di-GMP phosphodiesterase class II)